ncbi:hypothetical protein BDF19DRAFT_430908 [Syncephalis fuscata]|nr:hypothetical protein BDF19DRAFT_430908 [Syncephalis fuscata]
MPNVPNHTLRANQWQTPSPDRSFEQEHGRTFTPRISGPFDYDDDNFSVRGDPDDQYSEEPLLDQLGYPPHDDMEREMSLCTRYARLFRAFLFVLLISGVVVFVAFKENNDRLFNTCSMADELHPGSGSYTHDARDIKGIVIEVDGASATSFVRIRSREVQEQDQGVPTLTVHAKVLVSNTLLVERTRVRTSRDGNIFMMHVDVPKQYLFYKCVRTEIELVLPRISPALHVLRLEMTNADITMDPSAIHAKIENFDIYAQNARVSLDSLNATAAAVGVHRGSLNATIWGPEIVHMNVAQGPVNISIPTYGSTQPTVRAESTDGQVTVHMGTGFAGWFVASAYRAVAAVRSALNTRISLHTTALQLKTGWCGYSGGEGRIEADSMTESVGISFS